MFVGLDKFNSQVEAWFASVKTAVQQSAAGLGPRVRLTVTPPYCPLNHRMQVIQIQIRRDEDSSPDLSGNIVDTDTYRVLRRYRAPLRTQRSRNLNAPTPSASF